MKKGFAWINSAGPFGRHDGRACSGRPLLPREEIVVDAQLGLEGVASALFGLLQHSLWRPNVDDLRVWYRRRNSNHFRRRRRRHFIKIVSFFFTKVWCSSLSCRATPSPASSLPFSPST